MSKAMAEYFILGLPYLMGVGFLFGVFFRTMIWYTVKRHEWFAREFEKRVSRYMDQQKPGEQKNVSFYTLSKRMLKRTFYESFAVRDRLKRRKGDRWVSMNDRIFLVKQGCAWLVKDILNQLKFLKWTNDTPKLLNVAKSTFHHNPTFNRVFGIFPLAPLNDFISIMPGLFVITGILGTFIGISGGLIELGGMNMADLDNTKNIMDRFLHEIAFAMKTSIFGIVFSLLSHVVNVVFAPERLYVSLVDRFENSLDLLWYRSDNNEFPKDEREFNENRDPVEALAEESVNLEAGRFTRTRDMDEVRPVKAS